MCITKNGSENREPFLADHLKKRRIWGMSYFQDASPESLGISSGGILRFLDRMEEKNIELHSFMVVRHGKCAAKGWWKPYAPELAHPLYSFGKTLTATAIGFATTGKNPVTGGAVSGSFSGASSEGAVRKSAEGHPLASPDHELRT